MLEKRKEIEKGLSLTKRQLSAYHFISIFSWKDFFQFDLQVINGCLCIFAKNETGVFQYLPPLGKTIDDATIDQCFAYMNSINGNNGVSRIENISHADLDYFCDDVYRKKLKGYEYYYFKNDLVGLKGLEYKSKRNAINHLHEHCSYQYVEFDASLTEACLKVYDFWAQMRKEKYSDDLHHYMIDDNRSVHQLLMKHYDVLGLTARVVLIDGTVKAYTFGYSLNEQTFCVLLEISDLNIKGLAVTIFHEFMQDESLESYPFINTMDDSMLKHLSVSKLSFRPSVLLSNHTVYQK